MSPFISQMFLWAIILVPVWYLSRTKIEAFLDKTLDAAKEWIICKTSQK